ncbi:MAG: hypothetical protein SWK90_15785 [Chloroflexota bacterium]|nr:hypothetical protein [Chloroflexota bacterium]
MKLKLIWLLVAWLMIVGLVGCGQMVPSLSVETVSTPRPDTLVGEAVVSTATAEPVIAPEVEPSSPVTGPSEEATPFAVGTPAPLGTAVLISPTQVIQEENLTVNPTIPSPSNPALQGLVMQAKEDLAMRLSVRVDQIDLIEAEAVIWPDSSLGCPQPGMMYTQVQHDGSLVRLRIGKRIYNYHSGGNRPPFLCEQATQGDDLVSPPGLGDQ